MRRTLLIDSYKDIAYEIMVSKRSIDSFSAMMGGPYSHCLYLIMPIEKFPGLPMPKLEECSWGFGRRIDYDSHPLSDLDFHGGVTFMDCKKDLLTGLNYVRVGCDYQHYGDENYASSDHTETLEMHAKRLIDELLEKFTPISGEEILGIIKKNN